MRRYSWIAAIIASVLAILAMLEFDRPEPPIFVEFMQNAYSIDRDSESDTVSAFAELDNELSWWLTDDDEKVVRYYAFRLTLASVDDADHDLAIEPVENSPGPRQLRRLNGPCSTNSSADQQRLMATESKSYTGNPDGPAIYGEEVVAELVQHGRPGVFWETCEPTINVLPVNDKGYNQRNYTLILATSSIPAKLRAFTLNPTLGFLSPSDAAVALLLESPLHMAAIGDSIIWGQGHLDDDKIHKRVGDFLETELNRPVEVIHRAHSGAIIGEPDWCNDSDWPGEILRNYPTIDCMFRQASREVAPERIDVIVMDGCINNVSPTSIALGLRLSTYELIGPDEIRNEARERCRDQMSVTLERIRREAPNARILVTGYFPLLSLGSLAACPIHTGSVLAGVVGTVTGAAIGGTAVAGAAVVLLGPGAVPLLPGLFIQGTAAGGATGAAAGVAITEASVGVFLVGAEERSRVWVEASDNRLAEAVELVRSLEEFNGFGVGDLHFIPIGAGFAGHEAFTVDPWLYSVDCLTNSDDPQEIRDQRSQDCEDHYGNDLYRQEFCKRGAAFHPNLAGVQHYVDRILVTLDAVGVF